MNSLLQLVSGMLGMQVISGDRFFGKILSTRVAKKMDDFVVFPILCSLSHFDNKIAHATKQ